MDLRNEILRGHSKVQSLRLAAWAASDPGHLDELVHLFLQDEYRVVQHAARVISIVGDGHPELLTPYLEPMIGRMYDEGLPAAVKRNVVRLLQHQPIPEALHGRVMNACFNFLEASDEAIAVRVFSMTVLAGLARHYHELNHELKVMLEAELELNPSPAFKSRALKILRRL